jgi:hypothetical protein
MKITPELQQAIRDYMDAEKINSVSLSQQLDVTKATVGRWLKAKVKDIKPEHWSKLEPKIKNYIKPAKKSQHQIPNEIKDSIRNFMELDNSEKIKLINNIANKLLNDE